MTAALHRGPPGASGAGRACTPGVQPRWTAPHPPRVPGSPPQSASKRRRIHLPPPEDAGQSASERPQRSSTSSTLHRQASSPRAGTFGSGRVEWRAAFAQVSHLAPYTFSSTPSPPPPPPPPP
eukprot:scaffold76000_cov53-Phaeocystis_antarctica.AAC.1